MKSGNSSDNLAQQPCTFAPKCFDKGWRLTGQSQIKSVLITLTDKMLWRLSDYSENKLTKTRRPCSSRQTGRSMLRLQDTRACQVCHRRHQSTVLSTSGSSSMWTRAPAATGTFRDMNQRVLQNPLLLTKRHLGNLPASPAMSCPLWSERVASSSYHWLPTVVCPVPLQTRGLNALRCTQATRRSQSARRRTPWSREKGSSRAS